MSMARITAEDMPLSAPRLRELEWFCRQYEEKRRLLRRRDGAGAWGALARADLEDMEQAAVEACGDLGLQREMLAYVSSADKPLIDWIPCGRRQFYERRRRFYVALHLRRVRRGQ